MGLFGNKKQTGLEKRWLEAGKNAVGHGYREIIVAFWGYVGATDADGAIRRNMNVIWNGASQDVRDGFLQPKWQQIYDYMGVIRKSLKQLEREFAEHNAENIKKASKAIIKIMTQVEEKINSSATGNIAAMANEMIGHCTT